MSRIGKKPITLPSGVTLTVENNYVTVNGPKGQLESQFNADLGIKVEENVVEISRPSESKFHKSIHGTTRALLNNMILGVSEGFKKELKMVGVGYRAAMEGSKLVLQAGYSHPIEMELPEGIDVAVEKNTTIIVTGIDKQVVGEFSANVRGVRPPEPYLGKGIRYVDEHVRRKEGKTA